MLLGPGFTVLLDRNIIMPTKSVIDGLPVNQKKVGSGGGNGRALELKGNSSLLPLFWRTELISIVLKVTQ
jgi:hypothetical protein